MSKVIYTATDAQYMVQYRWVGPDESVEWYSEKSFHGQRDAIEYAAKQRRNNPTQEYQVIDTKEDSE